MYWCEENLTCCIGTDHVTSFYDWRAVYLWVTQALYTFVQTPSLGYFIGWEGTCETRRHGYYLFHLSILCGIHSREATIRERCLLNSVVSVHSTSNLQQISGSTPSQMFKRMRWVGGVQTCSRRQLIHYAMPSDCILFDTILWPSSCSLRTCYSNIRRG